MNLDLLLIRGEDECWPWTGGLDSYGYARVRPGNSRPKVFLHRYMYELEYGPIPEGHVIDHLCENKICQNPKHLEAVLPGVNSVRSAHQVSGINARKSCCPKCGGDYEEEVRIDGGFRRFCRPCRNSYQRKWQRTRRELQAA